MWLAHSHTLAQARENAQRTHEQQQEHRQPCQRGTSADIRAHDAQHEYHASDGASRAESKRAESKNRVDLMKAAQRPSRCSACELREQPYACDRIVYCCSVFGFWYCIVLYTLSYSLSLSDSGEARNLVVQSSSDNARSSSTENTKLLERVSGVGSGSDARSINSSSSSSESDTSESSSSDTISCPVRPAFSSRCRV